MSNGTSNVVNRSPNDIMENHPALCTQLGLIEITYLISTTYYIMAYLPAIAYIVILTDTDSHNETFGLLLTAGLVHLFTLCCGTPCCSAYIPSNTLKYIILAIPKLVAPIMGINLWLTLTDEQISNLYHPSWHAARAEVVLFIIVYSLQLITILCYYNLKKTYAAVVYINDIFSWYSVSGMDGTDYIKFTVDGVDRFYSLSINRDKCDELDIKMYHEQKYRTQQHGWRVIRQAQRVVPPEQIIEGRQTVNPSAPTESSSITNILVSANRVNPTDAVVEIDQIEGYPDQ